MSPYQKSNYYPKSLTPLCSLYRTFTLLVNYIFVLRTSCCQVLTLLKNKNIDWLPWPHHTLPVKRWWMTLSINHAKGTTWGIISLEYKIRKAVKILTESTITAVFSSYFIKNKMLMRIPPPQKNILGFFESLTIVVKALFLMNQWTTNLKKEREEKKKEKRKKKKKKFKLRSNLPSRAKYKNQPGMS